MIGGQSQKGDTSQRFDLDREITGKHHSIVWFCIHFPYGLWPCAFLLYFVQTFPISECMHCITQQKRHRLGLSCGFMQVYNQIVLTSSSCINLKIRLVADMIVVFE